MVAARLSGSTAAIGGGSASASSSSSSTASSSTSAARGPVSTTTVLTLGGVDYAALAGNTTARAVVFEPGVCSAAKLAAPNGERVR